MPTLPKLFKIYYVASGFGLAKDAAIFKDNLEALGYRCEVIELEPVHLRYGNIYKIFIDILCKFNLVILYKKLQRLFLKQPAIVALHLEKVFSEKLFLNETHILIPNQEWFDTPSIAHLPSLDAVWCKSKIAANTFRQLKPDAEYIGFCSDIGNIQGAEKKDNGYFFSRIGRSQYRGGDLLIDIWSRHPEWPALKIVMHPERRPRHCPINVECIDTVMDSESFNKLSSKSQFHIYLSETEGFGHTIVEALGYGAVVLVNDAPPMNEVTNQACALMIDARYAGQKMLATRFAAVPHAVELAVERALSLSEQECEQYSLAATAQYQKLRQEFRESLARAIHSI